MNSKEKYFINRIKDLKKEFDNFECTLKQERKKTDRVIYAEEIEKVCKNCLLKKTKAEIIDEDENKIEIDVCRFLDTAKGVE